MSSYKKRRSELFEKYGVVQEEEKTNTSTNQSSSEKSSYKTRRDELFAQYVPTVTVDSDYVNSYFRTAESYFNSASTTYEDMRVANSAAVYSQREDEAKDLRARSFAISKYLEDNKDYFGEDDYNQLKTQVESIRSAIGNDLYAFSQKKDIYSNFESDKDYNDAYFYSSASATAERQKWYEEKISRIEELKAEAKTTTDPARQQAIEDELNTLNTEVNRYVRGEYAEGSKYRWTSKVVDDYYGIQSAEDFDAGSKPRNDYYTPTREDLTYYDSMKDTSQWYWGADGKRYDAFGNEIDMTKEYDRGIVVHPLENEERFTVEDRYGMWLNATEAERHEATALNEYMPGSDSWATAILDGDYQHWDQLTEGEVNIYYYLLNSQGASAASKYLDDMEVELSQRKTFERQKRWTEQYEEAGFLGKLFMNAAAIPAGVFGGALAWIDDSARQLKGEEINPYNGSHTLMHLRNTVTGLTAADLDETGIGIPFTDFSLGDIYQLGMSRLDSMLATSMFGGAGTFLLGSSAASNEAYRLYQQGASAEQITLGALSAGAAETIFEYVSFDRIVKLKDAKTLRGLLKNALIQGGVEASEEAATEFSNILTNGFIMTNESDWAKMLEENDGDTLLTLHDASMRILESAFGGFLMGGVAGGVQGLRSYAATQSQYTATGRKIMKADGGMDALKKLSYDVANGLTKQADKVAKKVESGSTSRRTANKVGRLHNAVKTSASEQNKADIVTILEMNRFNSEEANAIADAVTAFANGEQLTKKQEKILEAYENNDHVKELFGNFDISDKTVIGKRNKALAEFSGDIKTGLFVTELKEMTEKEFTPNGEYDVSKKGKAINTETNEEIDIKGVDSISKEGMILKLADGTKIDAKSVSFASENDALIYEAVAKLGENINAETANRLIEKYDGSDAMVFARGMAQAYSHGFYGIDRSEMSGRLSLSANLTEEQRNFAYGLGEKYRAEYDVAQKGKARTDLAKNIEEGKTKAPGEKGVYYRDKNGNAISIEDYMKQSNVVLKNDVQKTGIEAMRRLAETLGVRINVFESWVENGKRYYLNQYGVKTEGNPNGFYDTLNGEIYIALDAGSDYSGTMLFTIAHELTHQMRQWSPEHFTQIAKIVFAQAGFKGRVSELIALKQKNAEKKGKPIDYDTAMEEVVADAMETILKDGKVFEFMQELKQKDIGTWQKVKAWFKNLAKFLRKMLAAYSGRMANTVEGRMVSEFSENLLRQIEQIWAEGAVAAGENYQEAVDGYKAEQQQFSTDTMRGTADGAVVKSEATTAMVEAKEQPRTEYEAFPKQMMNLTDGEGKILDFIEGLEAKEVKGIGGKVINGYTGRQVRGWAMGISGFTKAQINRVNKFMDTMADFMEEAGVKYTFIGLQDVENAQLHYTYNADGSIKSIVLSAMVKNGDYPVNFDLSSICKKREVMSKLTDILAKRGSLDNGTVKLTPANIFKINTALKDAGYETACLGCFVESKRYNSMKWAEGFCKKWNDEVKKINPNATYFGYGDASFTEDSFTLEQAVKIDNAAKKFITTTKTERLANALKKYQAKAETGEPLVKSISKEAKKRLVKSETISDALKEKYLNCDPTTLNLADVEFLLENGILPGAALSNKQAVTEMVKSGEAYQHLLRPSDLLTDRGISKLQSLPNFYGVLYGHYGSATPKLVQSYTPYNSEIALLPASKSEQSLAEYLYSIAGVRMQSFSDFQIQNIYDYLQMVGDLAARKLPAHAYTKEISFARLLGMTGIKTNLSVMFDIDPNVDTAHAGLTKLNKLVHRGEYAKVVWEDEQGKWVYNIGDYQTQRLFAEAYPDSAKRFLQSIGFADAVKLQSSPGYSANCGIIGVGYSEIGIFAMLNDNRIRYIIPYHASSLPGEIKVATNISTDCDFTSYQNNMKIKEILDSDGNKVNWTIKEAYKRLGSGQAVINELNEKIRTEGWVVKTTKAQTGHGSYGLYENLQETNEPRQTASNFIDWCIGNSSLPLFYQFASHENYYKLIYDYNVYDCVTEEYAPQQAVTNTYPTMVDGQVQPGNVTDGGFDASYLKETADKQMAFMNAYNENRDADMEKLADNMEQGDYTLFQMRETVEESGDLLAYHNITQQLLLDVLNRKGLLMPSLAVTNKGMTDFGEISLLFDKSTIDPTTNSENKLYGADAWTPTQTKLKKNAKFDTDKTVRTVNTVKNRIGSKFTAELFNVSPKQFKETIIQADGSIYDAYAHNIGMQTAYAMEAGIISKVPTNKDGSLNQEALEKQLHRELDTDNGWRQYKKWLNNISDTIITSYDNASNEDILKNMKAQPATAKTFKLSETGELVVPAVEYSSIDDLRKNKNRLSENAAEATKAVADEFLALAKKIGDTRSVVDAINSAFANRYSTADIIKSFNSKGIKISNQTASELQSLYKKAVELPTQYFEAKPGREIGLDEVKAVVMPADSSYAELKGKLEDIGISVVEYDGSKESRVEALNSMDSLKFSDRDTAKYEDRDITQDPLYPDTARERSAFNRMFINKTNGLKRHMEKDIIITTDLYVYHVRAVGRSYKSKPFLGEILKKVSTDTISMDEVREEVINGTYRATEEDYIPYEETPYVRRRNDRRTPSLRERLAAEGYDYLLDEPYEGDTEGDRGQGGRNQQSNKVKLSDRDSEGNHLSQAQQEFFKDSKVRDASGNLLVMYHGTANGGAFTVFDGDQLDNSSRKSQIGQGFYFTNAKIEAESYMKNVDIYGRVSNGKNPNLHQVYLNITNPFDVDADTLDIDKVKAVYMDGTSDHFFDSFISHYMKNKTVNGRVFTKAEIQDMSKADRVSLYVDYMAQIGTKELLSNMVMAFRYGKQSELLTAMQNRLGYDGIVEEYAPGKYQYVAFSSEQIKNVDNQKPTADKDIRYSDRDTESVSNRSLLANAFEGIATPQEQQKVQEYKDQIALINAEEKKLRELNEQIKELSFAKGKRDTKKISELREEATKTTNRINTLDKKLLRLEAAKPLQDVLEREKKKAYAKAAERGREALAEYKTRVEAKQKETIDKWKETRKKAVENRDKTAVRHKIQRVVGELNNLLLREDKKHHVPDSLKKAVASALSLVNMDTVGAEERIAKYEALIAKEMSKANPDQDKVDAYTVTLENIKNKGEKMGQKLKELRDAYEEIQNSDDPDIANGYDPVIAGSIKELADTIGDTPLRNMTIEQLEDVYDMYKMVLTRVRDANKSLIESIKESISRRASMVVEQVKKVGGEHKYRASAMDSVKTFGWNNLKPVYAMERIGSNAMTEAFNNVRAGEDTWATDVVAARAYYLDKSKKYGYDTWDMEKKYTFKSTSDLEFELTLEQVMALYAYSKRDQALDHLRLGGFVFDSNIETYKEKDGKKSILKYKVNTADAHQLSPEILANIIGTLTNEQKGFVDEMQDYLSTVMGAKGNEVTMAMYGVKLFKEKVYFPLKSAKQFMFEQNEVAGEVRIKNSGFTNKTKPKANNPIILNNFMDVWANHVNDMSMYHAFVLPLEDFNRIFNYNSPKQEGVPPVSVKGTMQNAYGPAAVNYIKQLITDLNGGAMSDPRETFAKAMTAKFKKAKVFSSLSVVVQQPSAIGRAFALVSPKYFRPTKDGMSHDQLWEELKQYAPVAVIKEMGYFDTNMGRSTLDFIKAKEYSGFKEKAKAVFTDSDYRDEKLSRLPALADEVSWCAIWNAVKRETVATHKDLRPGSKEFLEAAGKRFTEVVTKTQVYDSVLARSANMRSKGGLMSMVTSFLAEPTTTANMFDDAIRKSKRGVKGYAGKAFASIAVSIILNNALVSLIYGMRDDDEDETFLEKYLGSFVSGLLDDFNPITYYPYLKDMWSLFQGYDIERTDMSLISDLADDLKSVITAHISEDGDVAGAYHDLVGTLLNIGGVPAANIHREVMGGINFVKTMANWHEFSLSSLGDAIGDSIKDATPIWGWLPDEKKSDKLYDALINKDSAYLNRLKAGYKDDDAYHSAVRKALRDNDPRIKEAAIAGYNGDPSERVRIAKLIIADGFDQDDVVMAINAEINELTPDEAESDPKKKGYYTAKDFAREIANGDQASAYAAKEDIIATAQKNGKTEEKAVESFVSSAKSELKDLYLKGEISEDKVVNALTTYCGLDEADALSDVQYWAFKQEFPDAFVDDQWFDTYYDKVADSGISIEVYMDYRDKVSSITGEGKKERRMAIINSLPISSAQKDALYYAEGWSEKNLYEAPWH